MILGFGSTETDLQRDILRRIKAGEDPKAIEAEMKEAHDRYGMMNRMEAPERYSQLWAYPEYPDGCRKLRFQHINRRHPFSPDGWAAITTTVFYDPEEDYD